MDKSLQLKPATRMSKLPGTGCGFFERTSRALFRPICVQSLKSNGHPGKFAFKNSCFLESYSTEKT